MIKSYIYLADSAGIIRRIKIFICNNNAKTTFLTHIGTAEQNRDQRKGPLHLKGRDKSPQNVLQPSSQMERQHGEIHSLSVPHNLSLTVCHHNNEYINRAALRNPGDFDGF